MKYVKTILFLFVIMAFAFFGATNTHAPTNSITIKASEDATVDQSNPEKNLGADMFLHTESTYQSPNLYYKEAFMKFPLTGFSTTQIESIKLRIKTSTASTTTFDIPFSLNVTGTSWSETSITYTSSRELDATRIADLPPTGPFTWIEVDVTSVVLSKMGSGSISFSITPATMRSATFYSKESAGYEPQLYITSLAPTDNISPTVKVSPSISITPSVITPSPTIIIDAVTPVHISNTDNPSTTQTTNASPTTVPTATPAIPIKILTLQNNAVVRDKIAIEITGPEKAAVDLFIQIPEFPQDKIYIDSATIDPTNQKGIFEWNTRDQPNGIYDVIVMQKNTTSAQIRAKVDNLSEDSNKPVFTQKDIILPSQFNAETIPTAKTVSIERIANIKQADSITGIRLRGKAEPNRLVSLLIFSNPIVVTVRADANGTWSYTLEKPLASGEHETYAVITRDDGTKVRSEVLEFAIAPALAAGEEQESLQLESASPWAPYITYGVATGFLILAGSAMVMMFYRNVLNREYSHDDIHKNPVDNPLITPPGR